MRVKPRMGRTTVSSAEIRTAKTIATPTTTATIWATITIEPRKPSEGPGVVVPTVPPRFRSPSVSVKTTLRRRGGQVHFSHGKRKPWICGVLAVCLPMDPTMRSGFDHACLRLSIAQHLLDDARVLRLLPLDMAAHRRLHGHLPEPGPG